VRKLYDALAGAQREAWVDWEGIPPSAEWLKEVYGAIEAADTFVFVLSPDSLTSQTCALEVAYALETKKRIVPLVCRDVTAPDVRVHAEMAPLADINWIFFRPTDDFDQAFQQLVFALDTDLAYWYLASRLLVRATEWESKGKVGGLALGRQELAEAEQWLAESSAQEPRPTALHVQRG
jgi:hypothetical protein